MSEFQEAGNNTYDSDLPDYLRITEWGVADVGGDEQQFGLSGSPTKVKKIENIVFQAKESKRLAASDVDTLIKELMDNHTIG